MLDGGASSALASLSNLGPDLIYLPEVAFDMKKFLDDVQRIYDKQGYVYVCVSEALKNKDGSYVSASGVLDSFGHQQLGSVAKFLEDIINQQLHIKTRSIELSLLQRSACHILSKIDQAEAIGVGNAAVEFALQHKVGMVSIIRTSSNPYESTYGLAPLSEVANAIKRVPADFINEEGNGVTQKLIDYVLPFIDLEDIEIKSANLFLKR